MTEENRNQEFRLKNTDKQRNPFVEKKKSQYEMMIKKHKKACIALNFIKHLLI